MIKQITGSLAILAITGWAGAASALPIFSNGTNNSFGSAQQILPGDFDLSFNIQIEDEFDANSSTTIPHVEIFGTGVDDFQYYAFSVGAGGANLNFDIDCADKISAFLPTGCVDDGSIFDSYLRLYDATEALIASNDDDGGDTGSDAGLYGVFDSFINASLAEGDYFIKVSQFLDVEIFDGDTYVLNISMERLPAPTPAPGVLALFGLGLAGLGFSRRKRS